MVEAADKEIMKDERVQLKEMAGFWHSALLCKHAGCQHLHAGQHLTLSSTGQGILGKPKNHTSPYPNYS